MGKGAEGKGGMKERGRRDEEGMELEIGWVGASGLFTV